MAVRGNYDKCENRNDNGESACRFHRNTILNIHHLSLVWCYYLSVWFPLVNSVYWCFFSLCLFVFLFFFLFHTEFGDNVKHVLRSMHRLNNLQNQAILNSVEVIGYYLEYDAIEQFDVIERIVYVFCWFCCFRFVFCLLFVCLFVFCLFFCLFICLFFWFVFFYCFLALLVCLVFFI